MSTRQTYTNLDFDAILDRLRRWMKSQDTFKDYDFEGAGLTQLLRVLSYNTNQQAFIGNMLFNELHLDTAEQRNNAASIASMLSYNPGSKKASKMLVDLVVTPPDSTTAPGEIVLRRENRFIAVREGTPYNFSPDKEYTAVLGVDGSYVFTDVTLLQGVWVANTYDVVGSAIDVYEIPNQDIDTNTLEVSVQVSAQVDTRNTFRRYTTPYDLGGQNGLYYLSLGRAGMYQIEFGDDQLSKKLEDGNIVVTRYLVTSGSEGNGLRGITSASAVDGFGNVSVNEKGTKTTGGADEETTDSIKRVAPVNFRAGGAAVVPSDYTVIVRELFPEADDVTSWGGESHVPKRYGYTMVAVKPRSSEVLSETQKKDLIRLIGKHNVGSITPILTDPTYYYLNVSTKVRYNPSMTSLDTPSLKKKVQDYVRRFSQNSLEKFERDFDLSQLTSFIRNIDRSFIGNNTEVVYEKRVIPELNFAGAYSLDFNKELRPGSVVVDGFTVSDADAGYTYSIIDDGKGFLTLQKKRGSETKTMGSAGSVDYRTGVVNLVKFRPNRLLGEAVIVRALSEGYDQNVSALRGDIIKVNQVNVELEAVANE